MQILFSKTIICGLIFDISWRRILGPGPPGEEKYWVIFQIILTETSSIVRYFIQRKPTFLHPNLKFYYESQESGSS